MSVDLSCPDRGTVMLEITDRGEPRRWRCTACGMVARMALEEPPDTGTVYRRITDLAVDYLIRESGCAPPG